MNPERRFRQLRDDDRWVGLPPTTTSARTGTRRRGEARPHGATVTTVVAFVIAGVVAVGLWAGLSGLRHAEPAALSPLPSTTSSPLPAVETPCTEPERLAPIGCSTYTTTAAAGVPGGTDAWTGALPPSLTLRVLDGKVTALISSGCNGLAVPISLSSSSMTPSGQAGQTEMLCGGARGVQERWIIALFHGTVEYTVDGSELRLTNGFRVLQLVATPPTAPAPSPSTTVTRAASSGCAPTTATTPPGARTAQIADVDGDGRGDTEWARMVGGDLQFGVTTASGATFSAQADFAGGGNRSFVVGTLANGVVVLLPSEGRSTDLWSLHGCTLREVRSGSPEAASVTGSFGISIAWNDDGGAATCVDGRLAALSRSASAGSAGSSTYDITARTIDVDSGGTTATLTGTTRTLAHNVDLTKPENEHYTGISCGSSRVLLLQ